MIKTAIFGGSGFIGQYIIEELLINRNREVTVFDIHYPQKTNFENFSFINISSLTEAGLVEKLNDIDEIIDLVYTSNPQTSFIDPVKDIIDNLTNTVNLFRIASNLTKLKKFIYISSGGTVYGNTEHETINEIHPTNPISPYGITKLSIEKYGVMYHQTHDFPIVIVRPSNAYGIGQRINTGQGFIAHAINSIINDDKITIFGKCGTIRDYIYVSDIANAVADLLETSSPGDIYNVGTCVGTSNIEILNLLEPLANSINKSIKIQFEPHRKFDVNRNVLEIQKISSNTKWHPQVSIVDGITKTWNWFIETQYIK